MYKNSIDIEFVLVPAGSIKTGSENGRKTDWQRIQPALNSLSAYSINAEQIMTFLSVTYCLPLPTWRESRIPQSINVNIYAPALAQTTN